MSTSTPFVDSTSSASASLSPDRAFVVHFYAAAVGARIEAGRAEHVRSGRTTHFGSWEELAAFVADVLGTSQR
ncbi:MAG: hypothetical protein U0Q12_25010 [Vicinamibacterales bacterium]